MAGRIIKGINEYLIEELMNNTNRTKEEAKLVVGDELKKANYDYQCAEYVIKNYYY